MTTHCTAAAEKPNSRSMEGRATFTMLKSSTTMKAAIRISASPSPWCSAISPAAGGCLAAAAALASIGGEPERARADAWLAVVVCNDMAFSHIRYATFRF